jgi:hypothetical protein
VVNGYGLPVTQPWGWALVSGKVEVVNCDAPPRDERVGERIHLVATEIDRRFAWTVDSLLGIDSAASPTEWQRTGIIGIGELAGWMRVDRSGAVLEQHRPDGGKPFRARKGVLGPFAWVFRKVRAASGDPSHLRLIRARFWESKVYAEELLSYARTYGVDGLTSEHVAQLERLGMWGAAKGKSDGG